jgi:hypothetical protein
VALSVVASFLGAAHGFCHGHGPGLGFWDGPL